MSFTAAQVTECGNRGVLILCSCLEDKNRVKDDRLEGLLGLPLA
jgi:hypothetical protein